MEPNVLITIKEEKHQNRIIDFEIVRQEEPWNWDFFEVIIKYIQTKKKIPDVITFPETKHEIFPQITVKIKRQTTL